MVKSRKLRGGFVLTKWRSIGKTKFIIFHTKGKSIDQTIELDYDDNKPNQSDPSLLHKIERFHTSYQNPQCRAYKILAVYMDETLSFDFHTNHIITKLNCSLFCINRAKNILPLPALISLHFVLVNSHLSLCPIITSCTNASNIQKISLVQRKAIRIITKTNILPRCLNPFKYYRTNNL